MKTTVFESIHRAFGAKMLPFAGYNMPIEYSGVNDEHQTVRQSVGVFDVSHMGVFWIKGAGALPLLQRVTTNDMDGLRVGRSLYSCICNALGGIVDDVLVYRFSSEKFFMVVNASNVDKDWNWLNEQNTFGASLENASDQLSVLAVQGPRAMEVIQRLTSADLSVLGKNSLTTVPLGGASEVIISSTGYTGSGGVEMIIYNDDALGVWNALFEAGAEFGIKPIGLAARDTLRLEMGYSLYGNDIDDSTSPLEANLGWAVKFTAGNDFVGRSALEQQLREGVKRLLVGIEMIDRGIPRHDYPVMDASGTLVGRVTSGTMSPSLKKGLGMAYVPVSMAALGSEVFVEVRGRLLKARVVQRPFQ